MNEAPFEDRLQRAAEVLRDATKVALACHVNPDADAMGSMLGLSEFLRARGVETVCSYGNEPFDPPRWVEALPGREALVEPKWFPKQPVVMVTLDCASLDRLAGLAGSAKRAGELIWIDHHVSNDGLGSIPLIAPSASSSAEIAYRLIRTIGGPLPDGAAAGLYAGVVTDTGKFQYEAVTPDVLRLGAELREFDFDHTRLVQALYEDNRAAYLRLLGAALRRIRKVPEADLVWTYLTQADLADAGVGPGETDDLIDVLRTARGVDVAAVLKQQRDGRFKVSLRSRGGHDLASVAGRFGGGGHRLASGYTSRHGLEGTVRRLVAALAGDPVEP